MGTLDHNSFVPRIETILPTSVFSVVGGAKDPRCPIEGVLPAIAAAEVAYDSHGASERMDLFTDEEAAHEITPRMWDEIDGWFERFL